jgi:hypothetical protein
MCVSYYVRERQRERERECVYELAKAFDYNVDTTIELFVSDTFLCFDDITTLKNLSSNGVHLFYALNIDYNNMWLYGLIDLRIYHQ